MIGAAVVGLGWWGRHLAAKIRDRSSMLRLVATVDTDPAVGADTTRLDDVLADDAVRAVVLCLPHSQHETAILAAAAAGKHVFCEKPLTLTAASARRAVDACRRAGVVLAVGHERRFDGPTAEVRRRVAGGQLGVVLRAEADLSHDRFRSLPSDHWRGSTAEAPAAGMTGMGVHLTDVLIAMLGPVEEVHAYTARRVLDLPSGDVVSLHLRFRSGPVATVSALSVTPFHGRLAVFGSEGWVELQDDDHPEAGAGGRLTTCRRDEAPVTRPVPAGGDAVLANLDAFASAVGDMAPYPISDAELVHNVAVLEATVRSARLGAPVALTGELAGSDGAHRSNLSITSSGGAA